ncbi:hypothetical protein D3C84_626340 [compost metagenome]
MLTSSRSTDSTHCTASAHTDKTTLDRARHHPLHRVDVGGGHFIQRFVDGVLLNPFFQGLTNPLTYRPLGCPFQHTTCSSLASQHLEQHGVAHHGAHGGSPPHLGITHGGAAGQVGRFLPGQPQLFLIREMGGLLILVDASERLAEGVAGRQLVKAHSQHGVAGVHPGTAHGPGDSSGHGCAGGNFGHCLGGYRFGHLLGRTTLEHGCGDSAANRGFGG